MIECEQEGSDITYQHMLPVFEQPSEVQKFYEGCHVFLTGASGLVGNLIVQKLISDCPGVAKIYLLMRSKKGKSPEERLEHMFKDVIYDNMKQKNENYMEKVQLIIGDCEQKNLGISEEDQKILIDNINVVFHCAATVRFDENLRKATFINVNATKDLLILAKKMQNLKSFVHVSTAYSHCNRKCIEETFYDIPNNVTPENLITVVESLNDKQLDILTSKLIHTWPNTYTYTKAQAETVVKKYGKGLPIAIVRPSIILSTYKEPVSGWINNYYGPVGIIMSVAVGLVHVVNVKKNCITDLVPADLVINSVIVAAYEIGKDYKNRSNNESLGTLGKVEFDELQTQENIPIFNCVSSPENKLTWGDFLRLCTTYADEVPLEFKMWHMCVWFISNPFLFNVAKFFLHTLPAYLVDYTLVAMRKKPMLVKAYQKIHKGIDVLSFFSCNEWNFRSDNIQKLWKKQNATDKKLFTFSVKEFSWKEYFFTYVRGTRVYLFKEPLDNVEMGKKKARKLRILHYAVVSLFSYFLLKLIWNILSFLTFILLF